MARERPDNEGRRRLAARPRTVAGRLANRPADIAIAVVAMLAGLAVLFVARDLFPYHSLNHDEGVYLQQAAMLLDGTLWLDPPVPEAVRPWFFVAEDGRMYSKYAPVAAMLFAPGLALGVPRAGLAAVAATSVALVGLLGREAFDDRVGVVAAVLVATAPLFVLTSATFLSYAPTTALNLCFALAYVRALRRGSHRYAALAGVAVGLAFFSRPYTAVLFALPFVVHALITLAAVRRDRLRGFTGGADTADGDAQTVTRHLGVIAALGTAFVGVTLAYNWVVTGDPLVFPYEAFAPRDGVGFGHRRILGHERDYTPAVALDANNHVLRQLVVRWGPLGWLGSTLAGVGLVAAFGGPIRARLAGLRRRGGSRTAGATDRDHLPDGTCRGLLAALLVTVSVGNVAFWGNLNVLADVSDPTDGLIAVLGPFYHFDLLLPLSVFGAVGAVALVELVASLVDRGLAVTGRRIDRFESLTTSDRSVARNVVLVLLLVGSVAGAGSVAASTFEDPVERNAEYRDDLAAVYEPFERADFEHALVFVPAPYGPWLNHPFQWLRNDPSFDGDVVYVVDRTASGDAASLAAFPDRTPYRFTYRGTWPPTDGVTPVLEPLSTRRGDRLRVETTVGVVAGARAATVRVEADGETLHYGVERLDGESETVTWTLGPGDVRVDPAGLRRYSDATSLPLDGPTTVTLSVTFLQSGGSTITYLQEVTVVDTDSGIRILWPPEERVCRLITDCGREGTYLPGGDYATGVSLFTDVTERSVAAGRASRRAPGQATKSRQRRRSSKPTRQMDAAMAAPPASGSSFVSPFRSR